MVHPVVDPGDTAPVRRASLNSLGRRRRSCATRCATGPQYDPSGPRLRATSRQTTDLSRPITSPIPAYDSPAPQPGRDHRPVLTAQRPPPPRPLTGRRTRERGRRTAYQPTSPTPPHRWLHKPRCSPPQPPRLPRHAGPRRSRLQRLPTTHQREEPLTHLIRIRLRHQTTPSSSRCFDHSESAVGCRTEIRGANPPSRTSTHEMGRSGPCPRRHTAPAGDRSRWAGAGRGQGRWAGAVGWGRGVRRVVVGWDKELPVSAHHDLSRPTRGGPIRRGTARRNRPAQPRHTLHLASLRTPVTSPPIPTTRPAITHASSRRARERRVSWAPPDPSTRANGLRTADPDYLPNAA